MKKLFTIIFIMMFTTISFSQHEKGDLLLEGVVSSSWTSLGLLDNTVFGTYITDNIAITAGVSAVFGKDPVSASTLGIRYHLSSQSLGKNPMIYGNLITTSVDGESDRAWEVGVRNRFYANSWLAFEPGIGVFKIPGTPAGLSSFVGVAYIF
tara:strand:- start:128 stop:583 length:456 start_codon:yes stop_codon:yes gene_type:complete